MIEFSFKRFLSFFDCFMPAALSRFGTLAEFGSTLLACWPIVELALELEIKTTNKTDHRPLEFFFFLRFTW